MAVHGHDAITMIDLQYVAVAALHAAEFDPSRARSEYRRAGRCCIVDTAMSADQIEDGMHACNRESRADTFELERCTQKGFLHAAAIRRVVACDTVRANEAHRFVGVALIDEASRQNVAVLDEVAVLQDPLIVDGEAIAGAKPDDEIDVRTEYLRQLQHAGIGET